MLYQIIPYLNKLPIFNISRNITELNFMLLYYRTIPYLKIMPECLSLSNKSQQHTQTSQLVHALIFNRAGGVHPG